MTSDADWTPTEVEDAQDWTPDYVEDVLFEQKSELPGATRSTYRDALHGPEPTPDWVIQSDDAWDTDLGILKTGKEAEVYLVSRQTGDGSSTVTMAAKRYRQKLEHMARYAVGRSTGDSRVDRAINNRSAFGQVAAVHEWARSEFELLGRLWQDGACVPYPVQFVEDELIMEFIGDQATREAAPRLVQLQLTDDEVATVWEQTLSTLRVFASLGIAHADLSPFNMLVDRSHGGARLVVIDLPQSVDVIKHPQGFDLLHRDCINVCEWFKRRGVTEADADAVFADLLDRVTPT